MNACKNCGLEIKWRTIDGQRIPMGCECGDGIYFSTAAPSKDGYTREVFCPKCRSLVYFVKHNGGSVWLDELGQPWPKHPCYDQQGSTDGLEEFFKKRETEIAGIIIKADLKTDLGQRLVYVSTESKVWELYPAPEFWLMSPAPTVGERVILNSKSWTLQIRDRLRFRVWQVSANVCGCGQLYISRDGHKERCEIARKVFRW